MGVVELTVALHYVLNTPDDKVGNTEDFCSVVSQADADPVSLMGRGVNVQQGC